jgi:hypothetical protein
MASPFGGIAARHAHQLLLDVPLDFDFVRARRLGLRVDGGVEALRHKAFANPFYTPEASAQGQDDLVIRMLSPMGSIGQQ